MLWQVNECATTLLRGFDLAWLPPHLPSQITAVRIGKNVGVQVDTIVGTVPLRNGDALQIRPKFGAANFMRMLVESESTQATGDETPVPYEYVSEESLHKLVIRPFLRSLVELESRSFRFAWNKVVEVSEVSGGELNVVATSMNLSARRSRPFVFAQKIRDYDVPENVLLAAAARCACSGHDGLLSSDDVRFLGQFARRFDSGRLAQQVVNEVEDRLKSGWYEGARGYYTLALRLALILLKQNGLNLGSDGQVSAEPVLFNSAAVYEAYVRQKILQAYHPRGLMVRKGFFPPRSLFKDGASLLEPDIVVSKDDEIRLLADAKYKVGTESAQDYYQAHVYSQRAEAPFFVLLYASGRFGAIEIRRHESHLGLTIYKCEVPLANLDVTEVELGSLHKRLREFRLH